MGMRRGFSLVELMVVVAVVGLLIGLLMPALSRVKAGNRALLSQANLRQWGIGTVNFCAVDNDKLPWEGFRSGAEMHLNFAQSSWWANAVPPFLGQKSYREISEHAAATGQNVPMPGDEQNIFVDPGAEAPPEGQHIGGVAGAPKPFFFCYVPNLQLNSTLEAEAQGINAYPRLKLGLIPRSSATILMLEMRTVKWELRADDPFYNYGLARVRSDWKRLAARHDDGGHVLLADGHVRHVDFEWVTTNSLGNRNPEPPSEVDSGAPLPDWNKPDLIWNPRGPAVEGPGS